MAHAGRATFLSTDGINAFDLISTSAMLDGLHCGGRNLHVAIRTTAILF